jgi:RNA 2',3'-cyclic 3'-phosphodiesterase
VSASPAGVVERLFVAAPLPEFVSAEVRRWQRSSFSQHPELRTSASLHVTLSFLGDTPGDRVPQIIEALGEVEIPPLAAALGEPLFLPRHGRKTVVALTVVDPSEALVRLQAGISAVLVDLGVLSPSQRAFLVHLTVARFRRPGRPFSLQNVNVEEFGLPSVILYSSVLEKGGAVHTPLATFPASK